MKQTIETETIVGIPRPSKPADLAAGETDVVKTETGVVDTDIYKEDVKNFVRRQITLENNMGQVFALVWGQYSLQMQAKVESSQQYPKVNTKTDLLGLPQLIKQTSFDFHTQKNPYHAMVDVEKAFENFRQTKTMTNEDYNERFKSLSQAFESCGGSIGKDVGLVKERFGTWRYWRR